MLDWENANIVDNSARSATDEELFLLKTAYEAPKNNIELYNQVLRQILQIIVALMGGSALFLDKTRLPGWALGFAMFFLFSAFVVALIGVYPKRYDVVSTLPDEIRDSMKSALKYKAMALFVVATLLSISFFFGIVGMLVSALTHRQ